MNFSFSALANSPYYTHIPFVTQYNQQALCCIMLPHPYVGSGAGGGSALDAGAGSTLDAGAASALDAGAGSALDTGSPIAVHNTHPNETNKISFNISLRKFSVCCRKKLSRYNCKNDTIKKLY